MAQLKRCIQRPIYNHLGNTCLGEIDSQRAHLKKNHICSCVYYLNVNVVESQTNLVGEERLHQPAAFLPSLSILMRRIYLSASCFMTE